jgi:hypothetical protein
MTAEQKAQICYWAMKLSILCETTGVARLLDGKGLPTEEEIHKAKENLDRAYNAVR